MSRAISRRAFVGTAVTALGFAVISPRSLLTQSVPEKAPGFSVVTPEESVPDGAMVKFMPGPSAIHFQVPEGVDRKMWLDGPLRDQINATFKGSAGKDISIIVDRPDGSRFKWDDIAEVPVHDIEDEFGYVIRWQEVDIFRPGGMV